MPDFDAMTQCIIRGKINKDSKYPPDLVGQDGVEELVTAALAEGLSGNDILKNGLIKGMEVVGKRFRDCEIFVPDVLLSAKAMRAASDLLKPGFISEKRETLGTFIIGTVQGDLHDIGKNLVAMMVEGAGFEVIDLGADVRPAKFVETAQSNPDAIVGMSALLTTTMTSLKTTVDALNEAGMNNKTIIGGAPVTSEYAAEISADAYAPDPSTAVEKLKALISA